jgi:hypothetical protein
MTSHWSWCVCCFCSLDRLHDIHASILRPTPRFGHAQHCFQHPFGCARLLSSTDRVHRRSVPVRSTRESRLLHPHTILIGALREHSLHCGRRDRTRRIQTFGRRSSQQPGVLRCTECERRIDRRRTPDWCGREVTERVRRESLCGALCEAAAIHRRRAHCLVQGLLPRPDSPPFSWHTHFLSS